MCSLRAISVVVSTDASPTFLSCNCAAAVNSSSHYFSSSRLIGSCLSCLLRLLDCVRMLRNRTREACLAFWLFLITVLTDHISHSFNTIVPRNPKFSLTTLSSTDTVTATKSAVCGSDDFFCILQRIH